MKILWKTSLQRQEKAIYEKVAAINVVLGKDSHVTDENLQFLIELRCKETVAAGAQVNVKLAEGNNVFVESIDVD